MKALKMIFFIGTIILFFLITKESQLYKITEHLSLLEKYS
ncbi:hypothetical protein M949_0656 [Riemerella anatipestifer CH3]|nr:hypothetical protein M949_0656 [Riemerella anatipestifer CH3]